MTNKVAMEEELKTLQKHVGGLVKTMMDMKSKVQALEKKVEANQEEKKVEENQPEEIQNI